MVDKELADFEFEAGIYPVSIPQQGKDLKVLIIHSDQMDDETRDGKPDGWYFSLETSPNKAWGTFNNAKDAFFGALKMLVEEAIADAETIDIKPTDVTLH